jgi:hypothetical protein
MMLCTYDMLVIMEGGWSLSDSKASHNLAVRSSRKLHKIGTAMESFHDGKIGMLARLELKRS